MEKSLLSFSFLLYWAGLDWFRSEELSYLDFIPSFAFHASQRIFQSRVLSPCVAPEDALFQRKNHYLSLMPRVITLHKTTH